MPNPIHRHPAAVRGTVLLTAASLVLLTSATPAGAAVTPGSAGGSQVYLTSDAAGDSMALTCTAGQVRYLALDLLACSATTSIIITGNAGNDQIDLSALQPADFPSSARTDIDPGPGADIVKGSQLVDVIEGDFQDVIQGLGGNDDITGGDSVFGGEGDDLLDGPSGQASGGPGDDVIRQAGSGPFDGGPGVDTLEFDFSGAVAADFNFVVTDSVLHVDVPAGPTSVDLSSIQLENYDFTLSDTGTQTWNSSTFSGAVDVAGLGGVDRLVAGPGEDFLDGGAGNDELTGGAGFDYLKGGTGDDQLQTRDNEVDRVICGDGVDTVTADAGDVLTGCEVVLLPAPPVAAPPAAVVPETGAVKGPRKVVRGTIAKFKFSSATSGAKFECKVDKRKWKSCASPYKLRTKKLKGTKHVLRVRAVVGSAVDPTPAKKKFKVVSR